MRLLRSPMGTFLTTFLLAGICALCTAHDRFFYHSLVQKTTGEAISIVSLYNTSSSSPPSPLCFASNASTLPHPSSLDQLAHMVCSQTGFPTFTSHSLISRHILANTVKQGYNLTCSTEDEGQSIHCTAEEVNAPCSSILQVSCGACTFNETIKTNAMLASPLYPVLPPGLSCLWHLDVGDGAEVVVQNLSLSNCATSYLSVNSYGKLPERLCREESGFQFKVQGRKIQIALVSGKNESGHGFRITINVSSPTQTGKVKSILMGSVGLVVFLAALILTTLVLGRRAQARRRQGPRRQRFADGTVAWRGPAPAAGRLSTAQLARASAFNLPPPSYSFATRQLPALPSPLPEEDVMESTRIEMQGEEFNQELSKIYESMGEMRAAVRAGSNFSSPPPRPQSPIYLSLEGSVIGKVKEEEVAGELTGRRRGSRLLSLQEGLRRLSSRAETFRGRIRTASCADEVDDDEVFLCSIVHEHD